MLSACLERGCDGCCICPRGPQVTGAQASSTPAQRVAHLRGVSATVAAAGVFVAAAELTVSLQTASQSHLLTSSLPRIRPTPHPTVPSTGDLVQG